MSEDIYAKPDLTKKVRFQAGGKEDRNTDTFDDVDSVRIYDNYWAEGSTPQDKSQDNTTEDQQRNTDTCDDVNNVSIYDNYSAEGNTPQDKSQDNTTEDKQRTTSVGVDSEKKTSPRAAALFLGLLCLLFLVAVIALVVVFILERNRLLADNANLTSKRDELQTKNSHMTSLNVKLTSERDELQANNSHMTSLNVKLTSERDELQANNTEMKSLTANLTEKMSQLESEKDNLIKERDRFKDLAECFPLSLRAFGSSCYLMSHSTKNWDDSRRFCQQNGANLLIISSEEEQRFFTSISKSYWIGLTDKEHEGTWKWVDGTAVNTKFWKSGQPDDGNSHLDNEDCAEISHVFEMKNHKKHNWNDLPCTTKRHFICEKSFG